jgi:hypothetical protein
MIDKNASLRRVLTKGWREVSPAAKKLIQKNIREDAPFALAPVKYVAGKFSKKAPEKIVKSYTKHIGMPLQKLDTNLGSLAQRGTKKIFKKSKGKLFSDTTLLQTGKKTKELTGEVGHRLPSIMAPVSKTSKVVLPFMGAMKIDDMINGGNKEMNKPTIKTADLHKAAEMLETLQDQKTELEKQARATELLYKQAELGQIIFPKTQAEYTEKVAELLTKDLNVVEEAIKMASATEEYNTTYGALSGNTSGSNGNARQVFEQIIIEN